MTTISFFVFAMAPLIISFRNPSSFIVISTNLSDTLFLDKFAVCEKPFDHKIF